MVEGKSFQIPKHQILLAYKLVKANHGASGIDGVDFAEYERNLKNNLYKLWNRMSSGSYFPKPVKGVEIPKKNGKMRLLGIPTIEDRIAQMVVRLTFEPLVEPIFFEDSYGYRPRRSAIDAVGITRQRCWRMPWVIEYDIMGALCRWWYNPLSYGSRSQSNSFTAWQKVAGVWFRYPP